AIRPHCYPSGQPTRTSTGVSPTRPTYVVTALAAQASGGDPTVAPSFSILAQDLVDAFDDL
ncbi:hypothetical protein, partial [Amycolatopsis magusensis]|uniref:hypothetical protein n=1 Tax=Amycolatopsis magusensis TaxID=882444 RepID=UPI003790A9F6